MKPLALEYTRTRLLVCLQTWRARRFRGAFTFHAMRMCVVGMILVLDIHVWQKPRQFVVFLGITKVVTVAACEGRGEEETDAML